MTGSLQELVFVFVRYSHIEEGAKIRRWMCGKGNQIICSLIIPTEELNNKLRPNGRREVDKTKWPSMGIGYILYSLINAECK